MSKSAGRQLLLRCKMALLPLNAYDARLSTLAVLAGTSIVRLWRQRRSRISSRMRKKPAGHEFLGADVAISGVVGELSG
jgi:hypothetical protein